MFFMLLLLIKLCFNMFYLFICRLFPLFLFVFFVVLVSVGMFTIF